MASNRAFEAAARWLRIVRSKQRTVASKHAFAAACGFEACFRSSVWSKGAPEVLSKQRHSGFEACFRSSVRSKGAPEGSGPRVPREHRGEFSYRCISTPIVITQTSNNMKRAIKLRKNKTRLTSSIYTIVNNSKHNNIIVTTPDR